RALARTAQAALGLVYVGARDRAAQLVEGGGVLRERRRVGLPPYRGPLPATDTDEAHPGELSDLLGEPRIGQVLDLGQRHGRRRQPAGEDRRIGRIDLAVHGRVRKVGRQEGQRRVDRRLYLLLGRVEHEAQRELQRD